MVYVGGKDLKLKTYFSNLHTKGSSVNEVPLSGLRMEDSNVKYSIFYILFYFIKYSIFYSMLNILYFFVGNSTTICTCGPDTYTVLRNSMMLP